MCIWDRFTYIWNKFIDSWGRFTYIWSRFIDIWVKFICIWSRFAHSWNKFTDSSFSASSKHNVCQNYPALFAFLITGSV